MQSTRQHILDYLEAERSASTKDMALAFGMSRVNIHHHLKILLAESKVSQVAEKSRPGRGRPERLYAINSAIQPDTSVRLLHGLLAEMAMPKTALRLSKRLKRLAARLLDSAQSSGGHITHRLVNAIKHLEELGYRPHWQAQPEGIEIILGVCPYSAIVADHPELCQMDTHMLQRLLDEKVEHTSKLVQGSDGLPHCVFRLQSQS